MKVLAWVPLAVALALPFAAVASGVERQPTAEGVRAVEAHWSQAFVTGDAAYLRDLLVPDYVSVSQVGVARDRDTIVSLAQKYAAAHPGATPPPAASQMNVRVIGTTAIVEFASSGDRSADVFSYSNGAWHALYSQHTAVAAPSPAPVTSPRS